MRDTSLDYGTAWLRNGLLERRFHEIADDTALLGHLGMRDTTGSFETGWLREGLYERQSEDMALLGGLKETVPALGRKYLKEALRDPETRDEAAKLATSMDPGGAMAKQVELDVGEIMHPTGKHKVVFKRLARQLASRGIAAEKAILSAMPYHNTPEGREALRVAQMSTDPEKTLSLYFTTVALDAFLPEQEAFEGEGGLFGYDDEDELEQAGMGFLKNLFKKVGKWFKGAFHKVKFGKIFAGIGIAAGAVLTGGAILPAVGAAVPAIAGVVGTVANSIFKTGGQIAGATVASGVAPALAPSPPPVQPAPQAAVQPPLQSYQPPPGAAPAPQQPLYQGSVAPGVSAGAAPEQAYYQAYQYAATHGQNAQQALSTAQEALAAAQRAQEAAEAAAEARGAPRVAQAGLFGGMDPTTLAMIGIGLFAVSQMGGGRRRNPGYRFDGKVRRPRRRRA